jgi:hypothetical protein
VCAAPADVALQRQPLTGGMRFSFAILDFECDIFCGTCSVVSTNANSR